MKELVKYISDFNVGGNQEEFIFFVILSLFWLVTSSFWVMVTKWGIEKLMVKISKREIILLLRRRIRFSLWLGVLSVLFLLLGPVFSITGSFIEGVYFGIVGSMMIVSGLLLIFVLLEQLFLDIVGDRTGFPKNWLDKILVGTMIFITVSMVLDYWGLAIAPILGGLGLLGIAVGLGAQDLFSNLISGLLIILEKRLNDGDIIEVSGVMGTVKKIGLRSTLIEQFDMTPTYIPNSMIASAISCNLTRKPHRRIVWNLGLEYKTSAIQLQNIRDDILEYLDRDDFLSPSEGTCMVRVSEFGDSAVNIYLHCFARTSDFVEWMRVKESLLLNIKGIVEDKHKASFAFPSMTIYKGNEIQVLGEGK